MRLPPRSPESARRLAPGRCRHGTALSWGRRSSCETLCAAQRAPCWTFGCAALSRGRPELPSPAPLRARVHVPLESIPSRVFTSCRPADPLGPAPTPTRFVAPSTASPGLAPCAAARPPSAAVPLSGFHNLSAVSWQARASRPCLMPQPPVGFSLQSLAPRRGRVRLSASLCSLAVLHRASNPGFEHGLFTPGFTDARASRRGGLVPHRSSDTVSTARARTHPSASPAP
jgi:hypothetical protein